MEEERHFEIPASAVLVKAFGEVSNESLAGEYRPDPERFRDFVKELRKLDEAERQQPIDDFNVRL